MSFKTIFAAVVAAVAVGSVQAFSGDGKQYKGVEWMKFSTYSCIPPSATFYSPNGGLGSCGSPIQNTDLAVALNPDQYSGGSNCGRQITINCKYIVFLPKLPY